MAFRRTDVNIPQELTFPETLAELGLTVNIRGQIVDMTTGEFFKFETFEKHRTNLALARFQLLEVERSLP